MAKKKLDPARCSAEVWDRDSRWPAYSQCSRKPWKDGWCKQHHPETKAARIAKRDTEWAIETATRGFGYDIDAIGRHVLRCVENGTPIDTDQIRQMAEDAIRKRDEAIAKAKGE